MDFRKRYVYNAKHDLLGKGGFSRVFKATDTLLEREVALKIFNPEQSAQYDLISEIKKVIKFQQENLCRYYDVAIFDTVNAFGEDEQVQVGVMEYLDGGELKRYLQKNPQYLSKLLCDVLKGLSYLHKRNIIHRDLKPQNILIKLEDDGPVAKITDFGISKALGAEQENVSALVGTVEYMAPEQFNPSRYGIDGQISTHIDLWSFGIMVYELVQGENLFGSRSKGTSAEIVMTNILNEEYIQKLAQLPTPYFEVVTLCLKKKASERAPSADVLLKILSNTGIDSSQFLGLMARGKETVLDDETTYLPGTLPETSYDETQVINYRPEEYKPASAKTKPVQEHEKNQQVPVVEKPSVKDRSQSVTTVGEKPVTPLVHPVVEAPPVKVKADIDKPVTEKPVVVDLPAHLPLTAQPVVIEDKPIIVPLVASAASIKVEEKPLLTEEKPVNLKAEHITAVAEPTTHSEKTVLEKPIAKTVPAAVAASEKAISQEDKPIPVAPVAEIKAEVVKPEIAAVENIPAVSVVEKPALPEETPVIISPVEAKTAITKSALPKPGIENDNARHEKPIGSAQPSIEPTKLATPGEEKSNSEQLINVEKPVAKSNLKRQTPGEKPVIKQVPQQLTRNQALAVLASKSYQNDIPNKEDQPLFPDQPVKSPKSNVLIAVIVALSLVVIAGLFFFLKDDQKESHIVEQKSIPTNTEVPAVNTVAETPVKDVKNTLANNVNAVVETVVNKSFNAGESNAYSYSGKLKNGLPTGKGLQKFTDGSSYNGGFSNGLYSGKGTLVLANGDKYVGNWAGGKKTSGTLYYANGTLYKGSFKNNLKHGYGKFMYEDGSYYEGDFKNDGFEGQGKLYNADGELSKSGTFKNGNFIN
jgi:serine/threonine protein kinase